MMRNFSQDKYPYKILKDGEQVMSLREDEVKTVNGIMVLEVGDAFERLLWESSNDELKDIRASILVASEKPSQGLMIIVKTIDKIMDQRQL
ncbi:hypothetical protein MHB43_29485 [Paenibacillus sp. FSL H8-0317]|uniref:hypothetical protein n=1 Tax=unclassified Paenibacillus TaxID=185978 RepID=UPI0030CE8E06